MHPKNLFALDLGTTKFCLAALLWHGETPKLELVDIPADGMHRGMVSDISRAERCLGELIEKAEKQLNVSIDKVVVGVAGSHLRGYMATHSLPLNRQNCTHRHVQRMIDEVETKEENPFREILHCVPVAYKIDHREEIDNPLGFTGSQLTGRFFVIDSDKDYLKDLIRICNANGLEVTRLYSEPFASASVSVDEESKQLGIAIADIGGGTTDGIIFQNGKPVNAFTINIAGSMMTKDIAVGLNLSFDEAEKIKHHFGLSFLRHQKAPNGPLDPMEKRVFIILGSRIHELGAHLANELKDFRGLLGGGILLTGGGAQVQEIDHFMADRFKVKVTTRTPHLTEVHPPEERANTRHATALGLLNLELGRYYSQRNHHGSFSRRYLDHFVNWIRELS